MKKIVVMLLICAMLVAAVGCSPKTSGNDAPVGGISDSSSKGTSSKAGKYTPADVMAGGNYKVVLGDYMNSITLYYENGKLVKLEEKFQKFEEEGTSVLVVEGEALAEYGFNFIDWDNASLQDILDGMKDYGGFGKYSISAVD